MESSNKLPPDKDFNEEDLLKDSYSIDDEEFNEEKESNSIEEQSNKDSIASSAKKINTNKEFQLSSIIEYIKDNDIPKIKEVLKSAHVHHYLIKQSPEGYTPYHYAIYYGNLEILQLFLEQENNPKNRILELYEIEGLPLLHFSISLIGFDCYKKSILQCFNYLLLNYGNNLIQKVDRLGRNIFHLIIFNDSVELLKIAYNAADLADLFLVKDNNGNSALNYFYIFKASYCFYYLFEKEDRNASLFNKLLANIHDFLEQCFINGCYDIIKVILNWESAKEKVKEVITSLINYYEVYEESNIFYNLKLAYTYLEYLENNNNTLTLNFKESAYNTALIYNKECVDHLKLPDDPFKHISKRREIFENSDRVSLLVDENNGIFFSNKFDNNFMKFETNRECCLFDILRCHDINYITKIKDLSEKMKPHDDNKFIDDDSLISHKTYETLFKSTGIVLSAVDLVLSEKVKNCFAILRPPGHHAGYYGAVENPLGTSNGFCFVNNVCIGAAYCRYKYREKAKKIAIIDFDVHHGNGTQELVQMLQGKEFVDSKITRTYSEIISKRTIKKIWCDMDDAKDVLFISIHHYDEHNPKNFYPYSGSSKDNTEKTDPIYPAGILNIPLSSQEKYDYTYRNLMRCKVNTRLNKFQPDVIFISAGFDGHENEFINKGYMMLQEYDYAFITQEIQRIANKYCNGRVISILEGGYNVRTGIVSSFVQSAMTHALFLNYEVNKELLGDVLLTKIKREQLYEADLNNFKSVSRFEVKPRRSSRISKMEQEKKAKMEQEAKAIKENLENKDAEMNKIDKEVVNNIKEIKEEDDNEINNEGGHDFKRKESFYIEINGTFKDNDYNK